MASNCEQLSIHFAVSNKPVSHNFDLDAFVAEIRCDPPFPPRDGGVQLRNARSGATVVFYCDDGYELLGNASLRCQDDGYWSGVEPKCKGACV